MGAFGALKRSLSRPAKETSTSEQLQKDMAPILEKLRDEKSAPPPSVVVSWVLKEVSECDLSDRFDRNVQMKVHAARLLGCWREYGAHFAISFAQRLVQAVQDLGTEGMRSEKGQRLACFLVNLLDGENGSPFHIKNGSQELWRPVLEELGQLQLTREKDWSSEAASHAREETADLLNKMVAHASKGRMCSLCGDIVNKQSDMKIEMKSLSRTVLGKEESFEKNRNLRSSAAASLFFRFSCRVVSSKQSFEGGRYPVAYKFCGTMLSSIKRSLGGARKGDKVAIGGVSPSQKSVVLDEQSEQGQGQTAAPSVVIPWVLQEVADSKVVFHVNTPSSVRIERDVELKLHAARLLECWQEYGDWFPKAFAKELQALLSSFDEAWKEKSARIACFLAPLFAGKDTAMHIARDSHEELWPSVLAEIERNQMVRSTDWAFPANVSLRDRTVHLLGHLARHNQQICNLCYTSVDEQPTKNAKKMMKVAEQLMEEITAFNTEARTECAKNALKRAPWEVEGGKKKPLTKRVVEKLFK
ncbi:hypothetical protein KFL_000440380 [Klebsormidium nitens]|uniref:Uncharacterized protein n=1 Tax=Klebsormidium nitens TaxID=105231 RepID=A0A1Y1HU25_KLENI|nr:hypothetical protein KFL_000440380 [Klebsormidium nitens]|eukprot:GAQ80037.1 hypothetical protein KFL_000440380 [Klebsormidium nitens]